MPIYKIIFCLFTFFPYLFIFLWAWPKGACRMQTDRSTDRQTNKQTDDLSRLCQRIGEQTKNRQGAGTAISGAYYIPVLTPDSACGLDRSAYGLDRSAYGLATSVSMQLWVWPSNININIYSIKLK